ncbi:MAG: carboxypeptidase regulatory-like domain-containing protein, partial [Terriglobia bacterium]
MSRHGSVGKFFVAGVALLVAVAAQSVWAAEIQGVVKSTSGAPVAGAFVKLQNAERRLTFMVVSQAQGRYTVKNLPPGKYVVQGIGGEMQSPQSAPVEAANGRVATMDVSLTAPRAPAHPNAWPGRAPGQMGGEGGGGAEAPPNLPDGAGKQIALTKCSVCHNAGRMVGFRADRQRWQETIEDMRLYMEGSTTGVSMSDQEAAVLLDYVVTNFAEGAGGRAPAPKPDPNSRLPRTLVTGEAARYIAVEYEIPTANTEPHEVTVDTDGNGWVTQRRGGKLGRLT